LPAHWGRTTSRGRAAAAGLPVGALDFDTINQATEGSVLARTSTVTAGEKLEFDWQLYTNDAVNLDYLFFSINGVRATVASASSATISGTNYALQTDLLHFEYTFNTSGTFNIAIGVTDVGDYSYTTSALVDNVRVSAVPEPGVVSLFGLAASGVAVTAISRRRKPAVDLA
jgi:hypothetical protein